MPGESIECTYDKDAPLSPRRSRKRLGHRGFGAPYKVLL